jgi:hypothetical protein
MVTVFPKREFPPVETELPCKLVLSFQALVYRVPEVVRLGMLVGKTTLVSLLLIVTGFEERELELETAIPW